MPLGLRNHIALLLRSTEVSIYWMPGSSGTVAILRKLSTARFHPGEHPAIPLDKRSIPIRRVTKRRPNAQVIVEPMIIATGSPDSLWLTPCYKACGNWRCLCPTEGTGTPCRRSPWRFFGGNRASTPFFTSADRAAASLKRSNTSGRTSLRIPISAASSICWTSARWKRLPASVSRLWKWK
jgi:hypothetical protein